MSAPGSAQARTKYWHVHGAGVMPAAQPPEMKLLAVLSSQKSLTAVALTASIVVESGDCCDARLTLFALLRFKLVG